MLRPKGGKYMRRNSLVPQYSKELRRSAAPTVYLLRPFFRPTHLNHET